MGTALSSPAFQERPFASLMMLEIAVHEMVTSQGVTRESVDRLFDRAYDAVAVDDREGLLRVMDQIEACISSRAEVGVVSRKNRGNKA